MPLKVEVKFHMRAKCELAEDQNIVRVAAVQSVFRKAIMAVIWPTVDGKCFHTAGTEMSRLSAFGLEITRKTKNPKSDDFSVNQAGICLFETHSMLEGYRNRDIIMLSVIMPVSAAPLHDVTSTVFIKFCSSQFVCVL
jgi:hypothetical protein